MLYMIELHYSDQKRDGALEYFWKHGTNNYEGKMSVKSLWVASQDQIAYALVKGRDSAEVDKAASPLSQFGKVLVRSVVSSDEL